MPALPKDRPPRLGRYQLVRQLGGAHAWTLWTAKDGVGPTAKDVLVKWVTPAVAEQLELRLKLAFAARSLREISHSGVARTLDLVEQSRSLAVVLENLDGSPLSAIEDRARAKSLAMPIGVAVRIAIEALSALDALHAKLTEEPRPSDISQTSLFLTRAGAVKVIDFEVDPVADTPDVIARRAPERLKGDALQEQRADVYAVGVLLWELLTGRDLFPVADGADPVKVGLETVVTRVDAPNERKVDRCPAGVAEVVAKALSRDPSDRFETADDMGQELFAATRGAIASPADVAAFLADAEADDVGEGVGDRQTVKPPEPKVPQLRRASAPPNPFERRTSPSGRPPALEGKPAGKVKLTVPMGKSTPPAPATKTAPMRATPFIPAAPPVPKLPTPGGQTQRMAVVAMPGPPAPPVAAAPTPPTPTVAAAPTPTAPPATPPAAPPLATPATAIVEARPPTPPTPVVFTQPMTPVPAPAVAPSAPEMVSFDEPVDVVTDDPPKVETIPTTTPAPVTTAPLALGVAAPEAYEELEPSPPKPQRGKLIAAVVGGVAMLAVVLFMVTGKSKPAGDEPKPPPGTSQKSAPSTPPTSTGEPTVKRDPGTTDTSAPSGDDGARGVGGGDPRPAGGGDPGRATGAGGAAPKASASEEKPPPPAPLRRKYNPKTI